MPSAFDLENALLSFSYEKGDEWRIKDACEGTQIFGSTGSGKTSGSGKAIAKAFLKAGFGGLVLTAKPDETEMWLQYAKDTGRENSVIVFGPQHKWRFNFLDYELKQSSGGLTENLVHLFSTVAELAGNGGSGGSGDNAWFQNAMKEMLRNAIDLLVIGTGTIRLPDIKKIIAEAPTSNRQLHTKSWQESSFCYQTVAKAGEAEKDHIQERDFDTAATYWFSEFPAMGDRTRSSIVTTFTAVADVLVRGQVGELFCTTTNIVPELTHHGVVLILDLPIKTYHDVGRYSQVLFKYIWQRATERRNVKENDRPVFLFTDESQLFMTSYDMEFQTTARSSRACTVYLTQNIPNYYSMMEGEKGKHRADSLLGNLQTKIFHANGDATTNQWAADVFSKTWQRRSTAGGSIVGDQPHMTASLTESLEYEVQPYEFTTLRKGGKANDLQVDGVIFQGGRIWQQSGKNYLHAQFKQTD